MSSSTATCRCGDVFTRADMQAASDALWTHDELAHHGHGIGGQLTTVTWQEQALEEIRRLAATGREFTIADIHGRIPDPVHHNHWGAAARVAAHMGLIEAVATQKSDLPTTKGSRLLRWKGTFAARRNTAA